MPTLFEAYVTNLGTYNEGELLGEYLKFPTTPEEVQALLKRIGIDGVRYEEIFITDFDGDVLGLYDHLGEYENLDELNHLACLLSELDQSDLEKFEAVIDSGEHTSSVADLINLTQNLDCFEFYPDVHSDEELGRMYVLEFGGVEVPEHLIDYIDYEAYGRDVRINESGHFAPGGYVFDNYIDRLSCHIASSGKRYKSHAATIYKWAQEDATKKAPKKGIPDYSCKEGESL